MTEDGYLVIEYNDGTEWRSPISLIGPTGASGTAAFSDRDALIHTWYFREEPPYEVSDQIEIDMGVEIKDFTINESEDSEAFSFNCNTGETFYSLKCVQPDGDIWFGGTLVCHGWLWLGYDGSYGYTPDNSPYGRITIENVSGLSAEEIKTLLIWLLHNTYSPYRLYGKWQFLSKPNGEPVILSETQFHEDSTSAYSTISANGDDVDYNGWGDPFNKYDVWAFYIDFNNGNDMSTGTTDNVYNTGEFLYWLLHHATKAN